MLSFGAYFDDASVDGIMRLNTFCIIFSFLRVLLCMSPGTLPTIKFYFWHFSIIICAQLLVIISLLRFLIWLLRKNSFFEWITFQSIIFYYQGRTQDKCIILRHTSLFPLCSLFYDDNNTCKILCFAYRHVLDKLHHFCALY